MEAVGASVRRLHLRQHRRLRGRGSMALLLGVVALQPLTLRRSASACAVVRCTLTLILHLLFPPSPLLSTYTLHPHPYPLILYVPPSDGMRL